MIEMRENEATLLLTRRLEACTFQVHLALFG